MTAPRTRSFFQALGPGLLFAGTAIGVSHLVQSTRAGALFGFGMVAVVLLANVIKYPAFLFGPLYGAATGTSLLEGYRRQGRWALVLYAIVTAGTMFTVQGAVTIVTAGLAQTTLGVDLSAFALALGLTAICAFILLVGHFRWLDRIIKVTVALLTVSTLAATVLALSRVEWAAIPWVPNDWDQPTILFTAALAGWMPTAIDISVWHSLWTIARGRDSGHAPSISEARLDFNIGYYGTVLLALCFVAMGAAVMFGSGIEFSDTAGGFAAQVISLYTETLGSWSKVLISVAAFSVMFSTTLTVIDGFARAVSTLYERFQTQEMPWTKGDGETKVQNRDYWMALLLISAGSLALLYWYASSLKRLVDLATILSFLTAPVLAWLNHRVMTSSEVPVLARPSGAMRAYSALCVLLMALFAIGFLLLRFEILTLA